MEKVLIVDLVGAAVAAVGFFVCSQSRIGATWHRLPVRVLKGKSRDASSLLLMMVNDDSSRTFVWADWVERIAIVSIAFIIKWGRRSNLRMRSNKEKNYACSVVSQFPGGDFFVQLELQSNKQWQMILDYLWQSLIVLVKCCFRSIGSGINWGCCLKKKSSWSFGSIKNNEVYNHKTVLHIRYQNN